MKSRISELIIHPTVRPQQQRTFDLIQKKWSNYHSFFCSLPTGSGKTDLAACILSDYISNNPTVKIDILVPYRMHQDFWHGILKNYSIKHKFSVALLKGRASYFCPIIRSGANISPCAFDPTYAQSCRSRQRCALLRARREIRKSQVRILNWWVFKYVDLGEDKATFRIFDEAHNLLNLESLLRVEINLNFIQNIAKSPELLNQFIEWEKNQLGEKHYIIIEREIGLDFIRRLQTVLSAREASIARNLNEDPQSINLDILREMRRITEMIAALSDLIKNPDSSDLSFFYQRDGQKRDTKLVLQPFDIAYIFSKLFQGSKNLFLSATIGDGEYLAKLLGLQTQYCKYIHETSSFDNKRHPFILLKEAEKLSTAGDRKEHAFKIITSQSHPFLDILKKYRLRSLILASSFELARLMEKLVKTKNLDVITHSAGKSDKAIRSFISDRRGDVLVTPSAWEGISLDDDLARICIIPKLPFPMMGDPIVRKKSKKYPQFLENAVLVSVQQAHGRIQRNDTDWGVTICLDGNFRWLSKKRSNSLEPWFSDRIHELPSLDAKSVIQQLASSSVSDTKTKKPVEKNSKNQPFSRMKNDDRKWLESSGLADLLKK
jgi:Rad3-related DNA helicase